MVPGIVMQTLSATLLKSTTARTSRGGFITENMVGHKLGGLLVYPDVQRPHIPVVKKESGGNFVAK